MACILFSLCHFHLKLLWLTHASKQDFFFDSQSLQLLEKSNLLLAAGCPWKMQTLESGRSYHQAAWGEPRQNPRVSWHFQNNDFLSLLTKVALGESEDSCWRSEEVTTYRVSAAHLCTAQNTALNSTEESVNWIGREGIQEPDPQMHSHSEVQECRKQWESISEGWRCFQEDHPPQMPFTTQCMLPDLVNFTMDSFLLWRCCLALENVQFLI